MGDKHVYDENGNYKGIISENGPPRVSKLGIIGKIILYVGFAIVMYIFFTS